MQVHHKLHAVSCVMTSNIWQLLQRQVRDLLSIGEVPLASAVVGESSSGLGLTTVSEM